MLVKVNKRVIYNLHNMYIYIKTPDNQSKRPLINNKKGHLKKKILVYLLHQTVKCYCIFKYIYDI